MKMSSGLVKWAARLRSDTGDNDASKVYLGRRFAADSRCSRPGSKDRHEEIILDKLLKTLVLTRFRPDRPAGGAALRNWQNINALAILGPVDVVSLGEDDEASEQVEGVREWLPFSHRRLAQRRSELERLNAKLWLLRPGVHPSIESYNHHDVLDRLTELFARVRYDLAVIEELSLARYAQFFKRAGCRVVFDAHNVEGVLRAEIAAARFPEQRSFVQRVKHRILRNRLLREERRIILDADIVWACSEYDAREIKRIYGGRPQVTVVPNGVNVNAYARASATGIGDQWDSLPITMLYAGSFGYQPNEDAAIRLISEVLPALSSRGYAARIILVGRAPTSTLLKFASGDGRVEVTGAVESVLPYLGMPCVVTLPIRLGSGTRLKILEAFAASRPVVSTAKGAEGIDALDGEHILLRESPEAIADAVISLWNNPDHRAHLCKNALALVRSKYSWDVVAEKISESVGVLNALSTTAVNCVDHDKH